PEVFSITATSDTITAHHNAIIPEGVEKAEIGLWSRTAGQIPGPWRYHGLAGFPPGEPGTTTETSRPWPAPEPGVVYQLHARYRYDDQWAGPFFYEDWFDPTGPSPTPTPTPAPPPEILDMSVTPDETDPFITITTNGFVSYPATKNYLGFWYRQTMPPTPWTYMGLHPYANGQTEVEIPIPFELMEDVEYEFGTRVRTDAGGWETDFTYLLFLIESQAPVFSYTRFAPGMTSSAYLPLGSTPDMGDRLPASRLSFSFWAGTGPGPLGASRVDAIFTPSLAGVENLPEPPSFNGVWEVTWERENWDYFDFYLYFNEGELEGDPVVYYSPNSEGPWEPATSFSLPPTLTRPLLSYYIFEGESQFKSDGLVRFYLVVLDGEPDLPANKSEDVREHQRAVRHGRVLPQGGAQ
ncbi:MAG: hypothetical protein JJU11_04540, partial [Candidatus Sumerlaeia bacterium]|nr:hypothetical protein [Candidatus Sumerlaeia bacterium]